jgi:RNA polymerase-binding transcription factor DksA
MEKETQQNNADPIDVASEYEMKHNRLALQIHFERNRNKKIEKPKEDADGSRYCLDCLEVINQERVKLVNAVRCVRCAEIMEKKK